MPRVNTFNEARKLHNPPPLITYFEVDSGVGRATLSGFDRPWRAVSTLGAAVVTAISSPRAEGTKANKITWNATNTLTIIATTLATGVNLGSLETVRFFVRSDKTGLQMRLGLGESSAGEFLPDIAGIVTANVFVERSIAIDTVQPSTRDAIKKLRIELYGAAGKSTTIHYFDNLHAIKRARYANIFTVKPGVILPDASLSILLSGIFGHLMNNTYPMDDTGLMGDGNGLYVATSPGVDLSSYRSLSGQFTISHAPATLTFGFGENLVTEQQNSVHIVTAGTPVNRVFSLTSILASARNAVRYFALTPVTTPTGIPDFEASINNLTAHVYSTPNPITPYRIFHEKLVNVEPIVHSIGPVQSPARISNTRLRLSNHDSEFYRLRDLNPVLNRNASISMGFQDFPETETQIAMRGVVRNDSVGDEAYEIELEDVSNKLIVDLPSNTIQDRQYIFPENYGAGTTVFSSNPSFPEASSYARPHPSHLGSPIPLAFGHCYVPMLLIHRGFHLATGGTSPIVTTYKFLDESYGEGGEVVRIFLGNLANEYHTFGSDLGTLTAARDNPLRYLISGWVSKPASGLIFVVNDYQTFSFGTGIPVTPHYAEIRGYTDDSNGTWTGTPGTTITNPSDVARFMLMNVVGLDDSEVNLTDLDSSRTSLQHYKIGRAITKREPAFDLLGGRSSQGGLASNVFSYFFANNVDGKIKIVPAGTSVVTSRTYRATGIHANIIRGSYNVRSQPERIITRIEVDTGFNVASAGDHSFVAITDTQAEAYAGVNTKEPLRIAGKWLANDINIMTIRYTGTSFYATITMLGEGDDTSQIFRFTSNNTSQNFTVDLNGASGNTISTLKQTIDSKSYLTATLGNAVSSALDSRFLRRVSFMSVVTTSAAATTPIGRIKFGYGKMLALSYLDYYNHNRNSVSWKSPWVGLQQELTQYVSVRSLGDVTARNVKILQTRNDPIAGTIDFIGEESS